MLEEDANNENIHEVISLSKQNSNLSGSRRPICICTPAERRRIFIQHVNVQAKGADKNILVGKKKNRRVVSPLKTPFENEAKKKLSTEGGKFMHL